VESHIRDMMNVVWKTECCKKANVTSELNHHPHDDEPCL